jgi:SAM-dependent methyltransferase
MNKNELNKYFDQNQELWDGFVSIHEKSEFYNLDGFKHGKSSLHSIELEEMGDVSRKSLLHLQCHFGMDTLSWARLGARVTGVDFSEKAIRLAEALAQELSIDARFIQSNIYDLHRILDDRYDIVFTSYGVLCWLPDLHEWGRTVHHFLKDTGTFYMVEFHPILGMFDDDGVIRDKYFSTEEPARYEVKGSYAEPNVEFHHLSYEWYHSLSDIINVIIEAGLRIEFVHEYPFSICGDRPFLQKGKDGLWRHRDNNINIPMMFSMKAQKY